MAERGEMSMATVEKWEKETPKGKKLPKRVPSKPKARKRRRRR